MSIGKTGIIGLGWFGHQLAGSLVTQGMSVWGTKRSNEAWNELQGGRPETKEVTCVEWSAEKGMSADMQVQLGKTKQLVLNISPRGFSRENYAEAIKQILSNLPPNANVLYISSTGIYEDNEGEINEESSIDETSTLWWGEKSVHEWRTKRATILRVGGLIGEDRHPIRFLSKKKYFDNPDMPVNLIHVDDLIEVVGELFRQGFWGETFNVCQPKLPNRLEFYKKEAERYGLQLPPIRTSVKQTGKKVNTDKMQNNLFYHPNKLGA